MPCSGKESFGEAINVIARCKIREKCQWQFKYPTEKVIAVSNLSIYSLNHYFKVCIYIQCSVLICKPSSHLSTPATVTIFRCLHHFVRCRHHLKNNVHQFCFTKKVEDVNLNEGRALVIRKLTWVQQPFLMDDT